MTGRPRILEVTALDATVHALLMPLLHRLSAAGYDVHVACSQSEGGPDDNDIGFPLHPILFRRKFFSFLHIVSFVQLLRLLRRERFDVVHVHTPIASVIGRLAARVACVPHVVYTAHGFYFHDRMPRRRRRAIIWLERVLARSCTDLVLSQSREDVETALRERIVRQRDDIVWIGNGIDIDCFRAERDLSTREEFGFSAEHFVVGFVGRIVREKGLDELITAMAAVRERVPSARLLVIGAPLDGDRDVRTRLHLNELVEQLDLQGVVCFAGPRQDVPLLLRGMDLFVLPSHREGMPRSILEAMATGLPVVATDIRGCREEVIHGINGLLVPIGDPAGLASAVVEILTDEAKRFAMGKESRTRAEQLFREEDALQRQIDALETLLKPKRIGAQ
jgi:glycosyltransferase involved in cell wall biosynthesis